MSLLRVGQEQLALEGTQLALGRQDVVGVIPGPCAYLFQISEGNRQDFEWFVSGHLEKDVELLVDENLQQVRLRSWDKPGLVTSLSFTFEITPQDNKKLVDFVRKQVEQVRG